MEREQLLQRFGQRLKTLRLERGVSQERLAELAGLHRAYISGVEVGRRNISLWTLHRLANALGITSAELADTEDL
jgi:transcriptional regulator with XRE-family HTH domain